MPPAGVLRVMRRPNLPDLIAARLLSRQGIEVVWQLYTRAAKAHLLGNWLSATSLIKTAEAAERWLMRRD